MKSYIIFFLAILMVLSIVASIVGLSDMRYKNGYIAGYDQGIIDCIKKKIDYTITIKQDTIITYNK